MMATRFLILLVTLVFLASGIALASPSNSQKLLTRALPETCSFSGEFKQKRFVRSIPAPLNSKGQFFFSCHKGLIWYTASPIEEWLIYGKNGEQFRADKHQEYSSIDSRLHSYFASFLLRLLSADTEYLNKNFSIIEKEDEQNDDRFSLVLKPASKRLQRALKSIELVESAKQKELIVSTHSGDKTQVVISNTISYPVNRHSNLSNDCSDVFTVDNSACDRLNQQ